MGALGRLRKSIKSALSLESDYRKLKRAVEEGRIAPYCGIDRYFTEVQKILGDDSLDAVELIMMLEDAKDAGFRINNVRDLLRYLALQAGIPEEW